MTEHLRSAARGDYGISCAHESCPNRRRRGKRETAARARSGAEPGVGETRDPVPYMESAGKTGKLGRLESRRLRPAPQCIRLLTTLCLSDHHRSSFGISPERSRYAAPSAELVS